MFLLWLCLRLWLLLTFLSRNHSCGSSKRFYLGTKFQIMTIFSSVTLVHTPFGASGFFYKVKTSSDAFCIFKKCTSMPMILIQKSYSAQLVNCQINLRVFCPVSESQSGKREGFQNNATRKKREVYYWLESGLLPRVQHSGTGSESPEQRGLPKFIRYA